MRKEIVSATTRNEFELVTVDIVRQWHQQDFSMKVFLLDHHTNTDPKQIPEKEFVRVEVEVEDVNRTYWLHKFLIGGKIYQNHKKSYVAKELKTTWERLLREQRARHKFIPQGVINLIDVGFPSWRPFGAQKMLIRSIYDMYSKISPDARKVHLTYERIPAKRFEWCRKF